MSTHSLNTLKINNKLIISTLFAILFFAFSILILSYGHLHEDAYILFQYSKKLATASGIFFDDVSGPTEGATDFLWMIALATLYRFGLDIGTSAALLNSLGLASTIYVVLKISNKSSLISFICVLLVLFSGGLSAALGGFSTLAYGGLYSIFTYNLLQKNLRIVIFLSVVICLFRPDGLLLVFGGVTALLFILETDDRSLFLKMLLLPFMIGMIYYVWRFTYFQSLLPLPLMVKAKTDNILEGLGANYIALKYNLLLLIPAFILVASKKINQINFGYYFQIGLGPFILLIALSFAHQSQNVGYRFQYPILLSFVFIYIMSSKELLNIRKALIFIPIISIYFGFNIIRNDVLYLTNNDYINSFPQNLRKVNFKVNTIAFTEAGRFPFWYDTTKMIDLVGLNSSSILQHGPEYVLNNEQPDLIFVNHAGRYDVSHFDSNNSFIISSASSIKINSEYSGKNPVLIAPESALNFAIANNYVAILVQYGSNDSNFSHVYFLSSDNNIELFTTALKNSIMTKISYYNSIRN